MVKLFKYLFKSKQQRFDIRFAGKSKDPNDYTKCELSTGWKVDHYYCTKCKKSSDHDEYISSICNVCGSFCTIESLGRTYRKIYIDGKWKYQIKYRGVKPDEIREGWYQLMTWRLKQMKKILNYFINASIGEIVIGVLVSCVIIKIAYKIIFDK